MKRKVVAFMLIMATCTNMASTALAAKEGPDLEFTEESMRSCISIKDSSSQPDTGSVSSNDFIELSGGSITYAQDDSGNTSDDTSDTATTETPDQTPAEIIESDPPIEQPDLSQIIPISASCITTEDTKDNTDTVEEPITEITSGTAKVEVVEEEEPDADKSEYIPKVVLTEGSGEFVDTGKKDENGKPILEWRDTTKEKQDKKDEVSDKKDDNKKDDENKKESKLTKEQQAIVDYAKSIGWTDTRRLEYDFTFDEEPVIGEDSCSAGKLSDSTLQEALKLINLIRKTAGLGEVELDDELNNYAQHGALAMKASENHPTKLGGLTHTPIKADNITDEQYRNGWKGTIRGNLAKGHKNITSSILRGYMYDGYNNIQGWKNAWTVGHRRWILNPTMGKIGFGQVGEYSDMYAHDVSVDAKIEDFVAWPAENMPVELMPYEYDQKLLLDIETREFIDESRLVSAMDTPWSCQLGANYKLVPSNQLTITVTYPDGHEYVVPQDNIFCNDQNYGCAVPVYDKDGTLLDYGVRGRGCISFLAKDAAAESVMINEKRERYEEEADKIFAEMDEKKIGGIPGHSNPKVGFEDFGSNYKVKIEGVRDSKTGKATTIEYDVNFFELGL